MMHKQQLDVSESGVCIFFAKTAGSLTGAVGPRGATAISILVITITMPIVIVVWALAAIMLPPSLLLDGKNSFRRTICDIVLIRPLRVFFVTLVHVP
ncbi:MAG: hypothetical protein LBB38_00900, partial [Puniceicoccales bacterium]|nr:hypothetical protein [Puniceicoccales bacterium]